MPPGPHPSDSGLRVLHALRCVGMSGEERVARAAGLPLEEVTALLAALATQGLAEAPSGAFGGWSLTEKGRSCAEDAIADELKESGGRAEVERVYRSFRALNGELLEVCHDWQMRRVGASTILNDHRDGDYDAGVLSRLLSVDDAVQPVCTALARTLTRFEPYGPRLAAAVEEVLAGDHGSLADNMESYHTVWFQLHGDLLATLGLTREDERTNGSAGS